MSIESMKAKWKRDPQPCGDRLIVKVLAEEKTSGGGIILKAPRKVDSQEAIVMVIGEDCWKACGSGKPWAKVGDRVRINKYSGDDMDDIEDGCMYRCIHDEDLLFVYGGESL